MIAEITVFGDKYIVAWRKNGRSHPCPHCNINIEKGAAMNCKLREDYCRVQCLSGTLKDIVYRIYKRGHLVVIQ